MATQLDLQEQEQIDELKAFWKQYGNLITWTLIIALGAYSAWMGWNWWQRDQAVKASAMYEELDRAVQAGDAKRAGSIFNDLKERYPRTLYAPQGGLAAAKVQADKGDAAGARAALAWVAEQGRDDGLQALARIRLAGLLLDEKQYDEALKQLDAAKGTAEFAALAADRRGDVLSAQGKTADAKAAYQAAWAALPTTVEYRQLVEAKLIALGAPPAASAAASGAAR